MSPDTPDPAPVPAIRPLGRVRTRLLAAFLLLLCATVLLTAMGWVGMRRMQSALAGVEGELMPRISHALELSQRTAQLASTAPKLGDSLTRSELDTHRRNVEALLDEIGRGSAEMGETTPQLQLVINRLQASVRRDLPTLIQLSQQKLQVQARLGAQLARLDRLGQALNAPGKAADPYLSRLWLTLVLGAAVSDGATVGHLEADAEALQDRRDRQAVRDVAKGCGQRRRNRSDGRGGEDHAHEAARERQQQHLQHVGRQHLPRGRPQALEDRDAPELLPDEHARHAPHADAAEDHHDEAHEAQVVLGETQVASDAIFERLP